MEHWQLGNQCQQTCTDIYQEMSCFVFCVETCQQKPKNKEKLRVG